MKQLIFIFLLFISLACTNSHRPSVSEVHEINIESSLRNFDILPLSNYASQIRYVPLETNENCLISNNIKNMYLEDGKIFVHDQEPYLKVFDANTGKYLHNIGSKGQGPGELPYLAHVDINASERKILLSWSKITNKFDFDGNFLERIIHPNSDSLQTVNYNVVLINDSLYAAGFQNYTDHQENAVIVFDRNNHVISLLKSFETPIKHPEFKTWSPFEEGGIFYRTDTNIRFYRAVCDTIYTYNSSEKMFIPRYSLFFGKHRSNHNHNPDTENSDVVMLNSIVETRTHIFMSFYMKKQAPEPFEDTTWWDNQLRKFTNLNVYGIYDKKENNLHYLLQPIPKILGLDNDIDNGIPFWPKSASSSGEMIDYHQTYKFIEYAEQLNQSDTSFKSVLNVISEDDNPVVVIVKSK